VALDEFRFILYLVYAPIHPVAILKTLNCRSASEEALNCLIKETEFQVTYNLIKYIGQSVSEMILAVSSCEYCYNCELKPLKEYPCFTKINPIQNFVNPLLGKAQEPIEC
jgi:hypothetical protein